MSDELTLTNDERQLLDRRWDLYELDADDRLPHAVHLMLEKERDAIERQFGERLNDALATWRRERQEEQERQAAPLALTDEERQRLDQRNALLGSLYGADDFLLSAEERERLEAELSSLEEQFGDRLEAAAAARGKELREQSGGWKQDRPSLPPLTSEERLMLSDEDRRLLDRRKDLYDLAADDRLPHAAHIILETERDEIEQRFGERLDSALWIHWHEREEQTQQAEKAREARKPLVEKVHDCVKLLKARLSDMIEKATAPALKLYYSRRKEGLEAMKKDLGQEKTRGHAQGLAR